MPVSIASVESTELFVGTPEAPRQVLRVTVAGEPGPVTVAAAGPELDAAPVPATLGDGPTTVEVGVDTGAAPGRRLAVRVSASRPGEAEVVAETEMTVAEPGWTMHMVSHFHYDPVWWNTQAAYTSEWDHLSEAQSRREDFQHTGFDLVRAHLAMARRDPDYRFVLAEVDYLKPYWGRYPEDRALVRRLIAEDRLEIMGGTYNEPNTNLTSAESTARNLVYGAGFQRAVLGGDPRTAWQLDVFGHDPQFPGMCADAGLDSSSWARGPFHQWGPMLTGPRGAAGDARVMQFPSEFEWVSPSGQGLLTSYMPNHYSAGWWMDSAASLEEAEEATYRLFSGLKPVALTRNVLLPVGTDYTPPNRWVTEIHRDWARRYVWPRFVCSLPRDFFAAVRSELASARRAPSPQTRDMNPIYTGKDVSYIDTKQAQRATEILLLAAEKYATLAGLHAGAAYPWAALDKAWRQMVYGAHHDAITGSESDQVYLDLLSGWREAHDLARGVHDRALGVLAAQMDTSGDGQAVTVFNPGATPASDEVSVEIALPAGAAVRLVGPDKEPVAHQVRPPAGAGEGPATLAWVAADVPAHGYLTYRVVVEERPASAEQAGTTAAPTDWVTLDTLTIRNERYELTVDPSRGGCVSSLVDVATGTELVTPGRVGNELLVYAEYPAHPEFGEGPWHLVPSGPVQGSAANAAEVTVERGPLGERVTVRGSVGSVGYTQTLTLRPGVERVDCVTHVEEFPGSDELLRLRWPCDVPGALPVSEVGNAVIGRGFALPDVDSAEHPWTLDNPAYGWFGLSSAARIRLQGGEAGPAPARAVGVAEIIAADDRDAVTCRPLAVALARRGVTSTCSIGAGSRYGKLAVDSNLPDARIAVGTAAENAFTAAVLAAADPSYAADVDRSLAETGRARVWVPARASLRDTWVPSADLSGPLDLPTLIVAGRDRQALDAELASLVAELDAEGEISVTAPSAGPDEPLAERTVAILNRGIPSFAVDPSGALHLSLMRSCTGWPSGVWIDPPQRFTPDGAGFQLQHWSHSFEYSLVSGAGDFREAGVVAAAHGYNQRLTARLEADHPGPLPASGAFVKVEPPSVLLSALKATGAPLAFGRQPTAGAPESVTARLYEASGSTTAARIDLGVAVAGADRASLLEEPEDAVPVTDGLIQTELSGSGIATVVARPELPERAGGVELEAAGEPSQPVYSRYWLHNRGPAPLGNQLVSVHLEPAASPPGSEDETPLRLVVSSDRTDEAVSGRVRLIAPPSWAVDPAEQPFTVEPGGYAETSVVARRREGAGTGSHVISASAEVAGQWSEDVAVLVVGEPSPVLELVEGPEPVEVRPGERSTLTVTVRTGAHGEIHGEAQVVSPWGTWDLLGPYAKGFSLTRDADTEVTFEATVPAGTRPGRWWALVKLMAAGEVRYSPSVPVTVMGAGA